MTADGPGPRLSGKVAIVTGGASGIGAETARQFALHRAKVDTPMTASGHANNAVRASRLDATPLGVFGEPYDIAMGCVYLASDESRRVTGTELVIDGGTTAV